MPLMGTLFLQLVNIATTCVGECVTVAHIGFDVEHWSVVEEIDAFNNDSVLLYSEKSDRAKSYGVWAMWGTSRQGSSSYFGTARR